jgi:hypothetical protein
MALILVRHTTVSSRRGVRVISRKDASLGRSITVAKVLTDIDYILQSWMVIMLLFISEQNWLCMAKKAGKVKSGSAA